MKNPIHTVRIITKEGHDLQLFYNDDTGLVVLDVSHSNGQGGNELYRQYVDIPGLLVHCVNRKKKKKKKEGLCSSTAL